MKIITEMSLLHFEGWNGTEEMIEHMTEDQLETIEERIEDMYPDGLTLEELNDIFLYDDDMIADWLGFYSADVMNFYNQYGSELKIRIYNIKWDVDDYEDGDETIDLPTEVVSIFENEEYVDEDDYDLQEAISDYLSDEYGFCHEGFEYEIID